MIWFDTYPNEIGLLLQIKVLDMGMARGMRGDRPLTPELGTYSYMAPELLLENHKFFDETRSIARIRHTHTKIQLQTGRIISGPQGCMK